jgi:hypothetical protein
MILRRVRRATTEVLLVALLAATLVVATPRVEKAGATVCEPVLLSCWDEAYYEAWTIAAAQSVLPLTQALIPIATDLANYELNYCLSSLCPSLINYATSVIIGSAAGIGPLLNPDEVLKLANALSVAALNLASAAETIALREAGDAPQLLAWASALANAAPALVTSVVDNVPAYLTAAMATAEFALEVSVSIANLVAAIAVPIVDYALGNTENYAYGQIAGGVNTLNGVIYSVEHPPVPQDPQVNQLLSSATGLVNGALSTAASALGTVTGTSNGVLGGPESQAMALAATATATADLLVATGEAPLVGAANSVSAAIAQVLSVVGGLDAIGQPDLASLLNDDPSDDYDPSPVDEAETGSSAALKALDVAEGTALGATPVVPVVGVAVPGITSNSPTSSACAIQLFGYSTAASSCLDPRLPSSSPYVNHSKLLQYVHAHAASDRFNEAEYVTYDNDCTNFMSQALFAGGWQKELGDPQSDTSWYYGYYYSEYGAPYYRGMYVSKSWAMAQALYDFGKVSNRRYRVYDWSDIKVGDIISIKEPNYHPERIGHSTIVTGFDASGGILLSYHTGNHVGRENFPLATFKAQTPGAHYFAWRLK